MPYKTDLEANPENIILTVKRLEERVRRLETYVYRIKTSVDSKNLGGHELGQVECSPSTCGIYVEP